jgi:hypothetical protein
MNVPKQIKIGGFRYKVRVVDGSELDSKTGAVIDGPHCFIKLMRGDESFMHQSLLHEMFHAINMELPEETVEFLAQSLYQVIADNPQMFEGGDVQHGQKNK